ncbi:MAG: energy-coupling factor transporter transmembrane protein EcfT [Candidatus Heimdallarchaeota archaeon]|nr:energy-coupling factor transporter transmembrane protein EcfT [Candidatus Heimdallarchaeota archaeon]
MPRNDFLLPFRESPQSKAISPISLTIIMITSLVFISLNSSLINIAIIYGLSFIIFLTVRGRIFRTLKVVFSAFIIIFFLGLPSFFLHNGDLWFSLTLGKWTIDFYEGSVYTAIFIWVKGFCSVSLITLFTTAITMQEFIQSLRSIFIPNILVTLILLILRYTPMLFNQGTEIRIAQELRGLSSAPFKRRFAAASSRIGGTLIRSVRKGTEVYEAMLLRGLESAELVTRSSIKWLDLLVNPIIAALFSLITGGLVNWII